MADDRPDKSLLGSKSRDGSAAPSQTTGSYGSGQTGRPGDEKQESKVQPQDSLLAAWGIVGDGSGDSEGEGSSPIGASANFINSILGAGIIGLPYALNQAGFLPGILLVLIVAFLTDHTVRLLMRLGVAHGCSTYEQLVQRAFGAPGFWLVVVFQFLFAFGAMIGYLVIVKDTLAPVLTAFAGDAAADRAGAALDPRLLLALSAGLVILPICCMRSFSSLERFSMASLAAVMLMVVAVVARGPGRAASRVDSQHTQTWVLLLPHEGFASAIGTIAFAFVCHHQVFLVYDSLREQDRSIDTFSAVSRASVGISAVVSLAMAACGYLAFKEETEADIFLSFDKLAGHGLQDDDQDPDVGGTDMVIVGARLGLVLNMTMTYPSELMVCRSILHSVIGDVLADSRWKSEGAPVFDLVARGEIDDRHEESRKEAIGGWEHWVATVLLWVVSLGIALAVDDLGNVLEITGSFSAVFIAFVLPAATHLMLGNDPFDSRGACDSWEAIGSVVLLCVGSVLFVVSTTMSILSAAGVSITGGGEADDDQG